MTIHIFNPLRDRIVKGILCPDSTLAYTYCGLCSVDIDALGNVYEPSSKALKRYHNIFCKKCLASYKSSQKTNKTKENKNV